MTAEIIKFPPQRTCRLCVHFEELNLQGHCALFDEYVKHPKDRAKRCPSFEGVTRGQPV